jgi:catechol 2,3-dioxygenase
MIPQLTHIGLFTKDILILEKFYTQVLGLVVTDRGLLARMNNTPIVFLSGSENSHHQLVLAVGEPVTVMQQLSFKVNTLDQLRAVAKRASDYGVEGFRPWDHGNAWSVYFFDPQGNLVEVYMDTIFHVAQPHGRALDLGLSDQEILNHTFNAIKDDPTFCYMEEWQTRIKEKLNDNSN